LNYKSKNFEKELREACGDDVDIYFDNVAGTILDATIPLMKQHGVIVACGGVSGYNDQNPTVLKSKNILADAGFTDLYRLHARGLHETVNTRIYRH
jgi:NADPH-dependent curcumin reductase CurA